MFCFIFPHICLQCTIFLSRESPIPSLYLFINKEYRENQRKNWIMATSKRFLNLIKKTALIIWNGINQTFSNGYESEEVFWIHTLHRAKYMKKINKSQPQLVTSFSEAINFLERNPFFHLQNSSHINNLTKHTLLQPSVLIGESCCKNVILQITNFSIIEVFTFETIFRGKNWITCSFDYWNKQIIFEIKQFLVFWAIILLLFSPICSSIGLSMKHVCSYSSHTNTNFVRCMKTENF